jgi:hypothetical protein
MAIVQRPYMGALLLGLCGGLIPVGAAFSFLDGAVDSPRLFGTILIVSPITVLVSAVAAILGRSQTVTSQFAAAVVASLGVCVPVPFIVCTVLVSTKWSGREMISEGLVSVVLFLVWAVLVGILGWVTAILYRVIAPRRADGD